MKYFILGILFFSSYSFAESIGFGTVAGIKQYDMGSKKQINIYLEPGAQHTNPDCIENDRPYGHISHSLHDEAVINRMLSIVLAGHMADKKIRLYSDTDSCEIDFVAIQESVF